MDIRCILSILVSTRRLQTHRWLVDGSCLTCRASPLSHNDAQTSRSKSTFLRRPSCFDPCCGTWVGTGSCHLHLQRRPNRITGLHACESPLVRTPPRRLFGVRGRILSGPFEIRRNTLPCIQETARRRSPFSFAIGSPNAAPVARLAAVAPSFAPCRTRLHRRMRLTACRACSPCACARRSTTSSCALASWACARTPPRARRRDDPPRRQRRVALPPPLGASHGSHARRNGVRGVLRRYGGP